jgi:hypothetical protein
LIIEAIPLLRAGVLVSPSSVPVDRREEGIRPGFVRFVLLLVRTKEP